MEPMSPEAIRYLLEFLNKWDRNKIAQSNKDYPVNDIQALERGDSKYSNYTNVLDFLVTFPVHKSLNLPLNFAIRYGHYSVATVLINRYSSTHGWDLLKKFVNNQASDGWTPLQLAADNGHLEMVRSLLHNGASTEVNLKTSQDETKLGPDKSWDKEFIAKVQAPSALYLAATLRYFGIVIELLRYGANPNSPNANVHTLTLHNNDKLLSNLLKAHEYRNGLSLLESAKKLGLKDAVTEITQHNSKLFYDEAINAMPVQLDCIRKIHEYPEQTDVYNHLVSLVDAEPNLVKKASILKRAIQNNENGTSANAMSAFMHQFAFMYTSVSSKIKDMLKAIEDKPKPIEGKPKTVEALSLTAEGTHTTKYCILSRPEMSTKKHTVNAITSTIANRHL